MRHHQQRHSIQNPVQKHTQHSRSSLSLQMAELPVRDQDIRPSFPTSHPSSPGGLNSNQQSGPGGLTPMGKQFQQLEAAHREFIERQHIFFNASAAPQARVNVSPRSA